MKEINRHKFKSSFPGIEADIEKGLTFWQIFALQALPWLVTVVVLLVAIIYARDLAVTLLGLTGWAKGGYKAVMKWRKQRSP